MTDIDWSDPTTCDEWIELPGTDGWYVARAHRTTVYAGSEIIEWEHASVEEASAEIALMVADHRRSAIEEALDEITETLATIVDEDTGADTSMHESAWVHAIALGIRLGIYDRDPAGFDPGIDFDRDLAERLRELICTAHDHSRSSAYEHDLKVAYRWAGRIVRLLPEAVR